MHVLDIIPTEFLIDFLPSKQLLVHDKMSAGPVASLLVLSRILQFLTDLIYSQY